MAQTAERSWPAGKKIKRPGLERLVANREIVIATGNHKRLRARQQGDKLRRVARKRIALADRDQDWLCYARRLCWREVAARASDASGESCAGFARWSGAALATSCTILAALSSIIIVPYRGRPRPQRWPFGPSVT